MATPKAMIEIKKFIILCVFSLWSCTWYTAVEYTYWKHKNRHPEPIKLEFDTQCSNLTLPDIATLSDGWKTVAENET